MDILLKLINLAIENFYSYVCNNKIHVVGLNQRTQSRNILTYP